MQSKYLIRALLLAACLVIHPVHAGNQGEDMKLTMQTICLGRFLVNVPKETNYIGGSFHYGGSGFSISKASREQVKSNFDARKHQIDAPNSGEYVHKTLQINTHPTDILILRRKNYQVFGRTLGFNLEAYTSMAGKQFLLTSLASHDQLDLAVQDLISVVSSLKSRRLDEIPAEPGFCIDDAYLAGEPSQPHDESARVRFGLKGHPDVWIYMYTDMNGDKFDGGLLARVNDGKPLPADLLEAAKGIRSLREGKHPVNGMHAEEILDAFPTDGGGYSHKFRWEARGKPRSVKEPLIVVELETATADGGMLLTNSSLTDKQAIELFDAIVNSIRLRPTTPGKSSDASGPNSPSPATPKRLPLKSKATSAVNCPQTGIWECAPNTPGIAEHRRFIVAGQGMPYGLAQRPARGLGRFIGMQEDDAVEITWTLVAYDKDAS